MTRCPASWLGCHRYEAQFDELPHDFGDKLVAASYRGVERDDSIRRVYVQSVCRHCGDVIDRLEK